MTQILRTEKLTYRNGGTSVIEDIDLLVTRGEHIVLTGPSGAGKTSLLLAILGFNIPTSGTIFFKGAAVGCENINKLRSEISYISQEPVTGAPTFRESLLLPFTFRKNRHKKPDEEKILKLLKSLKLDKSLLEKDSSQLSGGEKQRLAIARELLLDKEIFILDEITSSLDPESKEAVIELFGKKKYTIISISHDSNWISTCTRKIELRNGRIYRDTGLQKK